MPFLNFKIACNRFTLFSLPYCLFFTFTQVLAAPPLSLQSALSLATSHHPEIQAAKARATIETEAIGAQSWLDNPRLGLMQEGTTQNASSMKFWSISQEIKFPTKYFLMRSIQQERAQSATQEASAKHLEIRRKTLSTYFSLFSIERIIALLNAQRETLREVARAAESRYATGASPQQDEMKAHVEQTKIENELLLAEEEKESTRANLAALLNTQEDEPLEISKTEIEPPSLTVPTESIPSLALTHARHIKHGRAQLNEALATQSLSRWSYAPDFSLSYRRELTSSPTKAFTAAIEMTIPFWFFIKQTSETSQAAAKVTEAESNLASLKLNLQSELRTLLAQVKSHSQLLKIYKTALIPQATSTLNSSRSAYLAGRTGFLELLDSEQSLYEMRIAYYRNLTSYVDSLARLEEMTGTSLSDLPLGDHL